MKKVFLGGTCNKSKWRDAIIAFLKIEYFNPVVEVWTPECQKEEMEQRENCDYCLYVITPRMKGVYSIAEVADDSNKRPFKTIFGYLTHDFGDEQNTIWFDEDQIKSLDQVGTMVENNGGNFLKDLNSIVEFLNS
ncbi:nucleoside 2-deoxyribosyltransferase domain-containing protein [Clostridium akagii]|uniref:nucleoside 2-deoxyribosyltransferase domain-containing protein n=1 Tax=Clostridium akagii TaxID=91623 RepID=UPI00047D5148|nr:nucleoside 2-deoxyribosyltransferase domain-containing protein [Clostridium akagii]